MEPRHAASAAQDPHPERLRPFRYRRPQLAPLAAFYATLFGWEVTPRGPGYTMVATPEGGPNGAIVETETTSLVFGVVVSDLDKALALATDAGGNVLLPKTDNGWVRKAPIADPAGNTLTLIEG